MSQLCRYCLKLLPKNRAGYEQYHKECIVKDQLNAIYEYCEKIKRREVMESNSLNFPEMVDKYMKRIQTIINRLNEEK